MRPSILLLSLVGCGYLTSNEVSEIQDVDQDGSIAVRFGGDDCRDDDPSIVHCDVDLDGHLDVAIGGTDCDDADPAVNPDADELCNGFDDDCDGAVDADDDNVTSDQNWFADVDGDGFGDATAPFACDLLDANGASVVTAARRTRTSNDCDDTDASVRPGGTEVCDNVDNDCNGEIDELGGLWFPDTDGDGVGAGTELTEGSCDVAPQDGLGLGNDDCAPDDASIYPGAPDEPYDGVASDCVRDRNEWDVDGDGYVQPQHFDFAVAESDTFGLGFNYATGDCDDQQLQANPAVAEVCDGFDNDCDGDIDAEDWFSASASGRAALEEDVLDDVYADADGDGYFGTLRWLCPVDVDPALYAQVADDCMDAPRASAPGVDPQDVNRDADEICDAIDNDCDGRIDNADAPFEGSSPRFLDDDGDGYGVLAVESCGVDPEAGIVALGGDCDDALAEVNPGAVEICGDALRQDCSGAGIFDCDGDGAEGAYPDGGSGEDCLDEVAGTGLVTSPEVCDGLDNDCDGLVDTEDELTGEDAFPFWYVDADGDGYGVSAQDAGGNPLLLPVQVCDEPIGRVLAAGDCDDSDPEISPATLWYPDLDGDGFGAIEGGVLSCVAPGPDWALRGGDCADEDPRFHPETIWLIDDDGDGLGAADPTPNELDESDGSDGSQTFCVAPAGQNWVPQFRGVDCDDADLAVQGSSVYYQDLDGDGFGRDSARIEACEVPDGYAVETGDCNDTSASINPAAVETCSNADDDCDGLVNDEDPDLVAGAGGTPFFPDVDGDGFGDDTKPPTSFCSAPGPGWAPNATDCADDNEAINPGAIERCDDPADEDCDGSADSPDWYLDADGDSFGADQGGPVLVGSCVPPDDGAVYATRSGDCDDTEPTTYPGAPELEACDAIDSNCDDAPEPRLTWSFDSDGDGYGSDDTSVIACSPPTTVPVGAGFGTWVLQGGDCDDTDQGITFGVLFYRDADGDQVGNGAAGRFYCPMEDANGEPVSFFEDDGVDWSAFSGDCDDGNAAITLPRPYYRDFDGDAWGDQQAGAVSRCPTSLGGAPDGLVGRAGDCDDLDAAVNPDAEEIDGDGIDSNCNGADDASLALLWYPDADEDGLGDRNTVGTASYTPGYVLSAVDCDDSNPAVGNSAFVFLDADMDGVGTGAPYPAGTCEASPGQSLIGGDCDDTRASIRPGAEESCNGFDNDCDGLVGIDEDLDADGVLTCDDPDDQNPSIPYVPIWYTDADGDGFGDRDATGVASVFPVAFSVQNALDCDDGDATVSPANSIEFCNGEDDNCDGVVDATNPFINVIIPATPAATVYGDVDRNGGYSFNSPIQLCDVPSETSGLFDYVQMAVEWTADPGLNELLDCDDGSGEGRLYLRDADEDGVGANESAGDAVLDCRDVGAPEGFVEFDGVEDCAPDDGNRYAEATGEFYADGDGDGHFGRNRAPVGSCVGIVGLTPGVDCDDAYADLDPTDTTNVQFAGNQQELDSVLQYCGPMDGLEVHVAGDLIVLETALGLTEDYRFVGSTEAGDAGGCGDNACLSVSLAGEDFDLTFDSLTLEGKLGNGIGRSLVVRDARFDDVFITPIEGEVSVEDSTGVVSFRSHDDVIQPLAPNPMLEIANSSLSARPGDNPMVDQVGGTLRIRSSRLEATDPLTVVVSVGRGALDADEMDLLSAGQFTLLSKQAQVTCIDCTFTGGDALVGSKDAALFADTELGVGAALMTDGAGVLVSGALTGTRPGPLILNNGDLQLMDVVADGRNTLVEALPGSRMSVVGLEIGMESGPEPLFLGRGASLSLPTNASGITALAPLQAPLVDIEGGDAYVGDMDVDVQDASFIVARNAVVFFGAGTVRSTGTAPVVDVSGATSALSIFDLQAQTEGALVQGTLGDNASLSVANSRISQSSGTGVGLIDWYGSADFNAVHLSGASVDPLVRVEGGMVSQRSIFWSDSTALALEIDQPGVPTGAQSVLLWTTLRNLGASGPVWNYDSSVSTPIFQLLVHQEDYAGGELVRCASNLGVEGSFWITDPIGLGACTWTEAGESVGSTGAPAFDADHISTNPAVRDFFGSEAL